jgi:HPt (histidine-containing phosphotransfer) domain-containing protein
MTHPSPFLGQSNSASSRPSNDGDSRQPLLDLGVLRALIGDEPAIVREFLADYLEAARCQRTALNDAIVIGAIGDVRVLAHNLKSSSRSVGARRLGDACQALEWAALGGQAESVVGHMRSLEAGLALAEAEILAALDLLDGMLQGRTA